MEMIFSLEVVSLCHTNALTKMKLKRGIRVIKVIKGNKSYSSIYFSTSANEWVF